MPSPSPVDLDGQERAGFSLGHLLKKKGKAPVSPGILPPVLRGTHPLILPRRVPGCGTCAFPCGSFASVLKVGVVPVYGWLGKDQKLAPTLELGQDFSVSARSCSISSASHLHTCLGLCSLLGSGCYHLRPGGSHCQTLQRLRDALGPGMSDRLWGKAMSQDPGQEVGARGGQVSPESPGPSVSLPSLPCSPVLSCLRPPLLLWPESSWEGEGQMACLLAEATPPSRHRRLEPCYLSFGQEGGWGREEWLAARSRERWG